MDQEEEEERGGVERREGGDFNVQETWRIGGMGGGLVVLYCLDGVFVVVFAGGLVPWKKNRGEREKE